MATRKKPQRKSSFLTQLGRNIRAGTRLALWRRVTAREFSVSLDQAVGLVAVSVLLDALADWIRVEGAGEFSRWALAYQALIIVLAMLAVYVMTRWLARRDRFLPAFVMVLTLTPFFTVVHTLVMKLAAGATSVAAQWALFVLFYVVLLWFLVAVFRGLRALAPISVPRAVGAVAAYIVVAIVPATLFGPVDFFRQTYERTGAQAPRIDAEELFYAQPARLAGAQTALRRQRPGVVDLYFVGFAPYAYQDVFLKEVTTIRDLFDERFDTRGRSTLLINHRTTMNDVPLASASNLARMLRHLGRRMDTREDVLFLYLTSHGSSRHELSVEFWPLPLNDVTPETLRRALDESGIRWRVIVISACYSGGFIEKLRDDHTLIFTSARANRESFGCEAGNDFTYFGEAMFGEALRDTVSFIEAFAGALRRIDERERRERLTPSEPQLHAGAAILDKLAAIERRLARRQPPALAGDGRGSTPSTGQEASCEQTRC
jgi:hypothetical protein